jgi:hypothetical protein
MKLAAIVAAAPTKQQLLDYQNACASVTLYAYSITATNLPVLKEPPTIYAEFAQEFTPAKAHCMEWSGGIFPLMLSFPQTIASQAADLFTVEDSMASSWLGILIDDPQNDRAKAGLQKALQAMQAVAHAQLATAEGLVASLQDFSSNITGDAKALDTLAHQALAAVQDDQQRISVLNGEITDLKNQISTLNKLLTLAEIGMGVSIFVGLIGVVCCSIPGAQVIGAGLIVVGVLGEAASITGTVLLNKEINGKNDNIQVDSKSISDLHQDVIALQGVNAQFKWLEQANVAAQNARRTAIQMWRALDVELTTLQQDLTTAGTAATAEQYQQAKNDLDAASAAWQEVVGYASALAGIDYKWQDKDGNWHSFTSEQPSVSGSTIAMLPSNRTAA